MRIQLVTVGRKPSAWVREGFEEYSKRLPAQLALNLVGVSPVARSSNQTAEAAKRQEALRITAAIPDGARVVALDEQGKQWSSAELARQLEHWMQDGRDVGMLVGSADGLDRALIDTADYVWSLSRLTLPHALVPVIVAEQLYRAWSLLNNHPYHRA